MNDQSDSRLHQPTAPARPGDAPDFRHLVVSAAGSIDKPPLDHPSSQLEFLSEQLVRVLDADGQPLGPRTPGRFSDCAGP